MSAPLKCQHGRYVGLCTDCRSIPRAKALGENFRDWDKTWHALRLETHRRFARLLESIHRDGWSADTYYKFYDRPARGRPASYEEDPDTLSGAFYLAFLKMTDLTIDGRRIQGYNAESEWTDARERLFERFPAQEIPNLIAAKRLLIHGGNSSWSNQQRAPQLVRSPHLWKIMRIVAFGDNGKTPAECSDAEAIRRIEDAQDLGDEMGVEGVSIPACSKIFQCFAPQRWPVINTRANATVAERAGIAEVPEVTKPRDYLAFAEACREIARERRLPDLEMLDISFSNLYEAGGGRTLGA